MYESGSSSPLQVSIHNHCNNVETNQEIGTWEVNGNFPDEGTFAHETTVNEVTDLCHWFVKHDIGRVKEVSFS